MPHWKCDKCHHEWDAKRVICDWCGSLGAVVLEQETSFEKFAKGFRFGELQVIMSGKKRD